MFIIKEFCIKLIYVIFNTLFIISILPYMIQNINKFLRI